MGCVRGLDAKVLAALAAASAAALPVLPLLAARIWDFPLIHKVLDIWKAPSLSAVTPAMLD